VHYAFKPDMVVGSVKDIQFCLKWWKKENTKERSVRKDMASHGYTAMAKHLWKHFWNPLPWKNRTAESNQSSSLTFLILTLLITKKKYLNFRINY
jgi:hypothetical protein